MNQTNVLSSLLQQRILVLDGAMGTLLQQRDLTDQDFGGPTLAGCNENLNLTRPDVIRDIHIAYLHAGADIIETNTFGATPIVLAEYGLAAAAIEINRVAATLACDCRDLCSTSARPRFVAGSMGPTTKNLSVTGGITFAALEEAYYQQAVGLLQGGVDLLLLETAQDMSNVKAASLGILRAQAEVGKTVPLSISGTIEPMGTTLAGQTIEALYLSLEHLHPLSVGINCAAGPEWMRDPLRALSRLSTTAVSCYPNAGLPDENGLYHETPAAFADRMADFADQGWLNIAGGCCGTTPDHIRALRLALADKSPRLYAPRHEHAVAGLEAVFLEPESRPLLVGERTNVIGSRKFRQLIGAAEFEAASEIARAQVRSGAHVVDLCLADPDRDEATDMGNILPHVTRKTKAPLMIDSTDAAVVELALRGSQGKAIINSTNLEDGEARLAAYARLAVTYGAALVVGLIDERGMAVHRERKLEVARRLVQLLTTQFGLPVDDIIIDALTFPCGTGDVNYVGSAVETVAALRLLKSEFAHCPTILGVSNVSFGLPPQGREILNSVFLYHTTRAGLDYAIVNSQKLQRYASITAQERELSERLLFTTDESVVAEFTAFYRGRVSTVKPVVADLPLDERLARAVIDGSKEGLLSDLAAALQTKTPLEIINGPLMSGMNEVGRLFNNNELIVAEVLQSAEVMKASVSWLEPHMEKADMASRGRIVLATVKGDVHDIGKNLVEIILGNNGYEVLNLGIKIPPEQIIQACREWHPDMIGLSGLLVKSAQQMALTAQDLRQAGVDAPLLVGGAALTKRFTLARIAPEYGGPVLYARDAMEGLAIANRLSGDESGREVLLSEWAEDQRQAQTLTAVATPPADRAAPAARSNIRRDQPVFPVPDWHRHVRRQVPISHIRPYLNLQMLLGKHLGVRGNVDKLLAGRDAKATALLDLVESLWRQGAAEGWLAVHSVYQFFPAQSAGDALHIFDPLHPSRISQTLHFPRQPRAPHLCLADFVRPRDSAEMDAVAMMAVTAGVGVRALVEQWKRAGDYLRAHALAALALELAEASAEWLHQQIRELWGFPDRSTMTMRERFIARYQGIRVSFGYPACPALEDQEILFRLLQPQDIGVELTEGFMMDPEASVSALVFAHPEATYFSVDLNGQALD